MGESIVEATVINWHKKIGESIDAEEIVVEVATDKVDSEIPSPISGVLVEITSNVDDIVAIGGVLGRIDTDGSGRDLENVQPMVLAAIETKTPEPENSQVKTSNTPKEASKTTASQTAVIDKPTPSADYIAPINSEGRFYSPLVRNIARAEGISQQELDTLSGSGGEGRITKHDLIHHIERKKQGSISQIMNPLIPSAPIAQPSTNQSVSAPNAPATEKSASAAPPTSNKVNPSTSSLDAGDEIIEMDRMRKVIAGHMKNSQDTSATVTSFVEADATHLLHWRTKNKEAYKAKYNEALTLTPLFVEAVIKALGDYPALNASLDGDKIIMKRNINIGIATAMENGNLIVPVIKNAGSLNLSGLASQLNDITARARINKLKADEIQGGTFTISNIGTYGNIMGTPIINQPELAILALGAIKKKPVIQETAHGDIIAIRHMMFLSLSFDHRVIDGYLGGVFLNRIAYYIESFDTDRTI